MARRNYICITTNCCNFVRPGSRTRYCCDDCNKWTKAQRAKESVCSIAGCNKYKRSKNQELCEAHYMKGYRKDELKISKKGPRTKKCAICSKKFSGVGEWFCSPTCRATFNSAPFGDSWPCDICGEPIWALTSYPTRKTCSDNCRLLSLRLKKYGVEFGEYHCYVIEYGERCWICGDVSAVFIDHCHETGKFRGLLCQGHNAALGSFHDSIEELQKAIDYLKKFGA